MSMQQRIPNRIVIYAKDIMNITGLKERAARTLLARIKAHCKKRNGELVTIDEFCEFTGVKKATVHDFLLQ